MFSLEAPQSKRQHGSPALASLTDSLHLQQPVWHSSKVQVAAPRMSAKRVPRQQLRVANTSTPGPPIFLLTQHHRGLQAVLGFREQVRKSMCCFVLWFEVEACVSFSVLHTLDAECAPHQLHA